MRLKERMEWLRGDGACCILGDMQPDPKAPQLRISQHAIDRYRQRVADVSVTEAARRLAELAPDSTGRPRPRRWTNVAPGPGILFLYPHTDSDICLVVKGNTVVTVFSRVVCVGWGLLRANCPRQPRRPRPYRRSSPGSWPQEAA